MILNVTPATATGARIAKTWPNASIFNTKKREKRWTSSHREKALEGYNSTWHRRRPGEIIADAFRKI